MGTREPYDAREEGRAQYPGSDPREIAWTFWRAGSNSDEAMLTARQPDLDLPIHICGETFSRAQAWAEGALATAHDLADQLLE